MILFEYLNNSFSGAISIFTAVFGMAYPLLQECVQRIEDKYVCSHIASRFKHEHTYIRFNWLIVVCMIEAVTFPLLLQLWAFNWWTCAIVGIQLASVFILMLYTVLLIQLVLYYYDARKLFDRIRSHHDEIELPNLLCISQYASRHDLGDIYSDTLTEIFSFINEQRRAAAEGQEVTFSQPVTETINNILRWSYRETGSYFYERNDIIAALFDYTSDKIVSDQTYMQVWTTLNHIVEADNEQWFNQYWSIACQYYMFYLSNRRFNENRDERDRFLEMHRMLGGLLCMHRKFEWLEYMMTFSNLHPPRYELIPSSASQIFDALYDLEGKADDPLQWRLLARYPFIGLKGDVYDQNTIVKYVEEYLAMLLVRLWSVNDYNITYSSPMEFPPVTDDLDENDKRIKYMNRLKRGVRSLYIDYDLSQLHLGFLPNRIAVLDFASTYEKALKAENEAISGRHEIDLQKVEKIRQEIYAALASKSLNLPQGNPCGDRETITTPVYAGSNLDENWMLKGRHMPLTGYGEMMVEVLNANTVMLYGRILTHNSHLRHTYSIRYQDIFKAIDKLAINDNYVILLLGVYMENFEVLYGKPLGLREEGTSRYYADAEILFIDSRQSAIVVLRRDELPYYDYVAWDNPASWMEEIELDSHVYSNLEHLKETGYYLNIARVFRIEFETSHEFACLRVSLNEVNDEMELKDVRALAR